MKITEQMRTKLEPVFRGSPLLKHILTLLSGNVLAQVFQLVLTIFIARLFSVDDRGLFAVYGSVTGIAISIAAFRYDVAIVLPRSDVFARLIHKLATRFIVLTSLITSMVCLLLSKWVLQEYHSVALMRWLWFSGVTVFLVAQLANTQFWLTRMNRFKDIAINSVVRTLTVASAQLVLGLVFGPSVSMLILGTVVGQLVTLISLELRVPELWKPLPRPYFPLKDAVKKHWRMPVFNGPNTLVDAVRYGGINVMIASHAVAALGQFNLAWTAMQMPVALLAGSISQVFYKKLSTVTRGQMVPLVLLIIRRGLLFASIPFLSFYAIAPWIFPLIFGAKWDQAGIFAQALIPWLLMTVVTAPISNVFVVTQTQHWMLIFAIFYCAIPLAWLYFSPYALVFSIFVLGGLMALLLAGMLTMSVFAARRYDAGARIPDDPISQEA